MQGETILKAELKQAIAECERLRAENAQRQAPGLVTPETASRPVVPFATKTESKDKAPKTLTTNSPADQKVIRSAACVRGRDDVYAVRWEGKNGDRLSPAGIRDWESSRLSQNRQEEAFA